MMATVGTSAVVEPLDAKKRWVFKTTQNDDLIAAALLRHMTKNGVKTVAFIGFNDPYGDNWLKVFCGARREGGHEGRRRRALQPHRSERHRADAASMIARQARRDADRRGRRSRGAAAGDAARSGLEGADLPDARRGDRGLHQARQRQGRGHDPRRGPDARDRRDPRLQSDQEGRAELHQRVREAVRQRCRRRSARTPGTAAILLERAIPVALKGGKPGTEAFRVALRDALEQEREVVGCQGVFNMSPTNHNGMDERARVLVTVRDGKFRLLPE